MSEVQGHSACGPSTLWRSEVAVRGVRDVGACVVRLWSHVVALVFRELRCLSRVVLLSLVGVPAALAGKGLVIPIEPCSRGSPPYSLQVGTRCRRSLLPDVRGGGLFAMRCQQCEL
ncbi:hypothetical protein Taro_048401 [Colocasia esculenta]|uniref:Uncharacterized protein n=1 Tax=Colocasia esculenta TaxID=4460 RepID=A0A843X2N6_COLES|nr:hypothetical protein [Colocasia esculenta]